MWSDHRESRSSMQPPVYHEHASWQPAANPANDTIMYQAAMSLALDQHHGLQPSLVQLNR